MSAEMREIPKVSELTVEIMEETEEMSHRAIMQMRQDGVQITAGMTAREIVELTDKYYR